jgi:hypothetical protein
VVVILARCLAFACALHASLAYAYRPFDSTDASVAAAQEFELEFGTAYAQQDEGSSLVFPAVVANYGIGGDREIVLEGQLRKNLDDADGGARWSLVDMALSLKQIHRRGSLQEAKGVSVASECGLLLPTVHDESGVGATCALIGSRRWASASVHVNVELAFARSHDWEEALGVIVEGPDRWPVRPVSELTFEWNDGNASTALVGLIWTTRETFSLDAAVRYSSAGDPDEWEVRAGFTWALSFRHGE